MPQNFNYMQLSDEDAASIAALHRRAEYCKSQGLDALAWSYTERATLIKNRATVKALEPENTVEGELWYTDLPTDIPAVFPVPEAKHIHLHLLLTEGSWLTGNILELLREDDEQNGII